MRRVMLFFRRLGFFQGALYVLFLAYMAWAYSRIWAIPGGPIFVLSVLGIGIGVSSALMPLMYRNYLLSHKIVSASGWVLMIALIAIFRLPIPLPPLGYWVLHIIIWLQVASNFWIGTYEPRMILPDGRDLQQLLEAMTGDDSDKESAPVGRLPPANDDDDDNWYRKP